MTRSDPARGRVETSAGGVVIRAIGGAWHVLVIRDPYKKWGLPKGHAEDGERAEDTALREVTEETSLTDLRLGPELVTIDWSFHVEGELIHKYATFYLMYSDEGEPVPEEREGITECAWVRLEEAHERVSYENASEVVKIAQQIVASDVEGGASTDPRTGTAATADRESGGRVDAAD